MSHLGDIVVRNYVYYFDEASDKRFQTWFMYSGLQLLLLNGLYFALSYYGPRLMQNRKALELKPAMIVYNAVQIVFNGYMFVEALRFCTMMDLSCPQVDYSNSSFGYNQGRLLWLYFMNKLLDWTDTVFIVVRKRTRQLTFLHCYHHFSATCFVWLAFRYFAGGAAIVLACLNMFVHTVMYSYYLLCNLREDFKRHWFKRYITQLQLVQFVGGLTWIVVLAATGCECNKLLTKVLLVQGTAFIFLFVKFYRNAYAKQKAT